MTFFKFLLSRIKNTSANYWMILSVRIFVRLLGMITLFYFLFFLSSEIVDKSKFLYNLISTVFYFLFFGFLDWYLKTSLSEELKNDGLRWLNIFKWIPLCLTIVLVYLTTSFNSFIWPKETVEFVIYSYTHVWPMIFVPNLSFIIITLLIFYASAILVRNKQLKEENDLTI